MSELHHKTVAQLAALLQAREVSSVELTQAFLRRIEQYQPQLNAFITVTERTALSQAADADRRRAAGEAGPLLGVPIAHKDIFCTQGENDVRIPDAG